MKPKDDPQRKPAHNFSADALSAVIAHELNNIAVPLRGFVDLTLQTTAAEDPLRQTLDEFQVGLRRMAALAYLLESLAQHSSTPVATTLSACLASMQQLDFVDPPQLEWLCSAKTLLHIDLDLVRRAILALMLLAGPTRLTIAESVFDGERCMMCGKPFVRAKVFVELQARGLRPAVFSALRAPFDPVQKLRATQRLAIAALAHCTHLAGGHLSVRPDATSLSIALPR